MLDFPRTALRPLGPRWTDEFARSYLTLNDKQYLLSIVKNIIAQARDEESLLTESDKLDRIGKNVRLAFRTDDGYAFQMNNLKLIVAMGAEYRVYRSLGAYRNETHDQSSWTELNTVDDRLRAYRDNQAILNEVDWEHT